VVVGVLYSLILATQKTQREEGKKKTSGSFTKRVDLCID